MNKLNLFCPINTTSYGYHSSYTYRYLSQIGWDVAHIPIGNTQPDPKFKIEPKLFHHDAKCLRIWHQFQLGEFVGRGEKIAFTVFELETLNKKEVHSMAYVDKLITASHWGKSVCEAHGLDATVVPLGYDPEIFRPAEWEQRENTVFFNGGKFEVRKGHDLLAKAFNAAFNKDDEVTLVMMPSNPFLTQEQASAWENMYLKSKLGDKIQIIPRLPNHLDVYNVMAQVDCGVFPARAEGWGLESLELLGCGKHLIITDCTGHKEYANSTNSSMIDMENVFETAYDGVFFNGSSKWRKFGKNQFDQLVEHMRSFHANRSNIGRNDKGIADASEFSWSKSVAKLSKELL